MVHSLHLVLLLCAAPPGFDDLFTGKTLRFDYYHAGTAQEEHIARDQIRLEGEWPGSRVRLLDDTNLGKYLFVVSDAATNRPIYSRGFSSIYGEWETTREARQGDWRVFHESRRFPEVRFPVQLTLKKRGDDGAFREIHSVLVDPTSRFVNRSPLAGRGKVWSVFENGPAARKVDLLVLGDGYGPKELEKFHADVKKLVAVLFDTEPFRSRRQDFNVRAIDVDSASSGVSDPRGGLWRSTPLGLSFNAFDLDRYMLAWENKALRELAALAPYDTLCVLANTRKYGGGGIFNLWSTCASDTSQAGYIFVHEFGHSFAGLADEYYTSKVAYENFTPPGVEPWEPNITALLDPRRLKWSDLVEASFPVPTPWNQKAYDKASRAYQERRRSLRRQGAAEAELDALFAEIKRTTGDLMRAERHRDRVGAFEGAGYQAKGLYRSEVHCIMFSRNRAGFCKVCSRAIERVIRLTSE